MENEMIEDELERLRVLKIAREEVNGRMVALRDGREAVLAYVVGRGETWRDAYNAAQFSESHSALLVLAQIDELTGGTAPAEDQEPVV